MAADRLHGGTSSWPASDFNRKPRPPASIPFADHLLGFVHGEKKHFHAGKIPADPARGFQPVQLRHADIHKHHIGLIALSLFHGLEPISAPHRSLPSRIVLPKQHAVRVLRSHDRQPGVSAAAFPAPSPYGFPDYNGAKGYGYQSPGMW